MNLTFVNKNLLYNKTLFSHPLFLTYFNLMTIRIRHFYFR